MNRSLAAVSACMIATISMQAMAAAQLSTQVSAIRVEVGQDFTLQLTCMVEGGSGAPSDPRLTVPRGITAQGPSTSTQQNVSIINGRIQQQSGVTATWMLVATATGRFRLGPASIVLNGQRLSDRSVEIEVVERGSLPQANRPRRRSRAFDPFDPFGSDPFGGSLFPPGINMVPTSPAVDEIPSYPPDLNVDKPRDPIAFLDARVTPTRLVLGEQATLRIYAYGKPGPFELGLNSEPSRDDFLSYQNERDNPVGPLYRIKIDSEIWFARKILSYALFPTKSGRLRIGEADAKFAGAGLFGGNAYRDIERKSQALEITVEEPPVAGRPPGYHLGDVGNFKLSASVEPRKIKASESVSVQVEVSGVGQLPQRLDPPEQTGVDWLEPTMTQQIDDQRERIAGRRQFTYVVRIDRAGTVNLGTMRFPYFDPTTRRYAIASAELGAITVEATDAQVAPTSNTEVTSDDPFLAALHARGKLGSGSEPPRYFTDERGFFYWLGAGPVISLALVASRALWRRFAAWRARVTGSAKTLISAELKAAREALRGEEPLLAAASVERLVHLLIEHSVGLKSRAILRADLTAKIQQRGLDPALCERLVSLLERCDHVRFVQPNVDDARGIVAEAELVLAAIQPHLRKPAGRQA